MTFNDIKQISIRKYLEDIGVYPAKDRGYYGMYHSPFREDHNASMKVDYDKNLWIDFGSYEGGTIIDLVMRMENCSNGEAMRLLEQNQSGTSHFSFHRNENIPSKKQIEHEPSIQITRVSELNHPALLDYLKKRCVNTDVAKLYCKEVHYTVNGKEYFAVGFQNDSEGWVLRSEPFKGCTSMDVRAFRNDPNKEDCLVFEGFMDYLSYLTLKEKQSVRQNVVVLNSVINLPKAMEFIKQHPAIYTYLDNDDSGRKATEEIKRIGKTVDDRSALYIHCKDLNDYLVSTKKAQQEKSLKPINKGAKYKLKF